MPAPKTCGATVEPPIVVVEKGAAAEIEVRGAGAGGGHEGLATRQPPFRPQLRPIARPPHHGLARIGARQAGRALGPGERTGGGEPAFNPVDVLGMVG